MGDKKPSVVHMETQSVTSSVKEEVRQTTNLTAREQHRKLGSAIKADKRFCLWTLYTMLLVFGWGYDAGLSGVAVAFPAFREYYGNYYVEGPWRLRRWTVRRYGRPEGSLYTAVILSLASSFALVFAPDLPVLFVSKLLLGLSIGLSTAIPPLYVTENAPADLRSTASPLTNVIIVFGFFCSSLTGFGASHISGTWSFRLAFVMTFVMPALYLIGLTFFPESPVWYMKKGREADARKAALRLFGPNADIEGRIEVMKQELRQSEADAQSSKMSQTSWKAIFSKEHRTRTLVAVLGLQSQNFSRGYFANTYQTYYFELIGQSDPFGLTAISSSLQLIANFVAVCLSDVIPRRKGLIGGGVILMFWSVIIAGTSVAPTTNVAAATPLLAFHDHLVHALYRYRWLLRLGRVAQETAAQATRPKTISFVLVFQQLTALMLSSVFPYFINPDQLNWGGRVMFLFVGAELFIMLLLWFFQPETKNRRNTDIDNLYANGVPPRKFKDYAVVDGVVVEKEKCGGFFGKFRRNRAEV